MPEAGLEQLPGSSDLPEFGTGAHRETGKRLCSNRLLERVPEAFRLPHHWVAGTPQRTQPVGPDTCLWAGQREDQSALFSSVGRAQAEKSRT